MIAKIFPVDCIDMADHVRRGLVDVVVTSPPYNIGKTDAGEAETHMPDTVYLTWLVDRLTSAMFALKPAGSLFLNIAGKPSKQNLPFLVTAMMMNRGFHLQNTFIWVKSATFDLDGESRSVGHFKPINSKRFVNDLFEYVFHFTRSGRVELDRLAVGVPYQDKSNINRFGKDDDARSDLRCRGNVWFIPYKTRKEKSWHPTAFPPELPEMAIKLHGIKGPVVMDPFMGSGQTAVAAHRQKALGFYGFEINRGIFNRTQQMIDGLITT